MNNLECIVAVDKYLGIAKNDTIPWHISQDLQHFKQITSNNVVVMGYKTYMTLPNVLPNRINIILSTKQNTQNYQNIMHLFEQDIVTTESFILSFDSCIKLFYELNKLSSFTKKIFIIGGESIYNAFKNMICRIHLTQIDQDFKCDKSFFKIPYDFKISSYSKKHTFFYQPKNKNVDYYFLIYDKTNIKESYSVYENENNLLMATIKHRYILPLEQPYLNLCRYIICQGEIRNDRTGTGTQSLFGQQMRFDISTNIPILTTKRVPWKSCIEELLWFLRGDTDANILKEKGVTIWNDNSSKDFLDICNLSHLEEGDCGANYSFQWRHFGSKYISRHTDYGNQGVDQIAYIENLLKNEPTSRRIFLSAWNPCDLKNTVLPPCHVSAQFYVNEQKQLSCHMYQRSCDMFLGVPWNILSYTILTYILAFRNGFTPNELIISTGDTHVYDNHREQVFTQLTRKPIAYPKLILNENLKTKNWKDMSIDDFQLIGYFSHPTIKGIMSV